jgi:hypothetical protein
MLGREKLISIVIQNEERKFYFKFVSINSINSHGFRSIIQQKCANSLNTYFKLIYKEVIYYGQEVYYFPV